MVGLATTSSYSFLAWGGGGVPRVNAVVIIIRSKSTRTVSQNLPRYDVSLSVSLSMAVFLFLDVVKRHLPFIPCKLCNRKALSIHANQIRRKNRIA